MRDIRGGSGGISSCPIEPLSGSIIGVGSNERLHYVFGKGFRSLQGCGERMVFRMLGCLVDTYDYCAVSCP